MRVCILKNFFDYYSSDIKYFIFWKKVHCIRKKERKKAHRDILINFIFKII